MTPDEKIQKIKALQDSFMAQIEQIRKDYLTKTRQIVAEVEKKKIEDLKKDLGM
jgi:hypothetical protein